MVIHTNPLKPAVTGRHAATLPVALFAVLSFALLVAAWIVGDRWSLNSAVQSAGQVARGRATSAQSLLASQLQRYRVLPLVLVDSSEVQDALADPNPIFLARLNKRLALLADRTDVAVIYVVRADGQTIAASNWRSAGSFVGQNYAFRPYFTQAMRNGAAEQFALGTVSRRPGLFLARRAPDERGVVVVKVEFGSTQASWAHQAGATIVRDEEGVVVMSSRSDWLLHATRRLPQATLSGIVRARLYGEAAPPLRLPGIWLAPTDATFTRDPFGRRYVTATLPIALPGWRVTAIEPLEPALIAASAAFRISALAAGLILLIATGLWARAREARAIRAAAKLELERQVELQTAELRLANEQLLLESRERERNEARLRVAREEVAQSNRLATLGQITAGVAHEINQPLAALRSFAENAVLLIDRGRGHDATANLHQVVTLSERIGEITSELRLFGRRDGGRGPTALGPAIDGALLLMGDRLRQERVQIERRGEDAKGTMVAADRLRMEQILINLLQNAVDATRTVTHPLIVVDVALEAAAAVITVSDNGPGIRGKARRSLFKSFATNKPGGLGLGLVISRDLAREFGGELVFQPGGHGATFQLKVPRA